MPLGFFFINLPNKQKDNNMIWVFLIVTVVSSLLIKLGAVSVMAGLLAMALKASVILVLVLAGVLFWRWYR